MGGCGKVDYPELPTNWFDEEGLPIFTIDSIEVLRPAPNLRTVRINFSSAYDNMSQAQRDATDEIEVRRGTRFFFLAPDVNTFMDANQTPGTTNCYDMYFVNNEGMYTAPTSFCVDIE